MKNVGIIYNARIPEALELSTAIFNSLSLGKESWIAAAEDLETLQQRVAQTDLVITAGGDGTILRAARATAPNGVPIVGVNMGRLGFMTELQVGEALQKLPLYLSDECRLEERSMLQACVIESREHGAKKIDGPYHALNDAVVARGAVSRVVTVSASIDGAPVTILRVDAVILSTATGSTGYNLAVGGPILDPLSDALVLKPVAAHIGLSVALVLSPSSKVQFTVGGDQQAFLSIDGYVDYPLKPGDRVELKQSPLKARFLRADPPNYFYATLTRRLGFSIRGQQSS